MSSRVLLGTYIAAAVIAAGTLLAAPSTTMPPATVATHEPLPATPAATGGVFPIADDRPTEATTTQTSAPTQVAAAAAAPTSTETTPAPAAQMDVNARTRAALVNIFCASKNGGPISGSGIMVDNRGVILTNAHVGQFLLLQNALPDQVQCTVRTGSPAKPAYHAKLLYLSTAWMADNADKISEKHATGSGENDYAFLYVTDAIDSAQTSGFAAVKMTTNRPSRGTPVLLAGYPAGFLESSTIEKDLYITSSFTTVENLFTFSDNDQQVDLVSVGGTVVSQSGASGGSVVRQQDGTLLAVIATATNAENTAARDLRAITVAHIDRSLAAEGKGGIIALLTGDLPQKVADFHANTAPALTKKLLDGLKK